VGAALPALADGEVWALNAPLADGEALALAEDVAPGNTDALGAGVVSAVAADGADDGAEPCATALGEGSVVCGCVGSTLQLAKMLARIKTSKIESGRFRIDIMEFLLNTIDRIVRMMG